MTLQPPQAFRGQGSRIVTWLGLCAACLLLATACSQNDAPKSQTANQQLGQQDVGLHQAQSKVEFATKLGLIQGHLWVASELVKSGHIELAVRHAKHPAQEVYQELLPLFAAYNVAEFADQLAVMSDSLKAYSANSPESESGTFAIPYTAVDSAINSALDSLALSARDRINVALALLQQAELEYMAGVVNGVLVDPPEFQDARGFLQVANGLLSSAAAQSKSCAWPMVLAEHFDAARGLWPSLVPQGAQLAGVEPLTDLVAYVDRLAGNTRDTDASSCVF